MDIFGQTAQDHYVDYISKTFKKVIFSKEKKNKTKQNTEPPES